ncbi:HAD family hydrolase [Candidatus Pacearchaeota archaeon]|nr:HAD family hydrolase [Candidatus Pacearchaeota archaeon]
MNYIFDFFETLVSFDMSAYVELMSKSFGKNAEDYFTDIRYFLDVRDFGSREAALNALLNHLRLSFTEEQKREFFSKLDNILSKTEILPHAIEVLNELRKKGSKIAILSDNNNFVDKVIIEKGFREYVDVIVLSHKVGLKKPQKEIFELCFKKIGSSPENTIMVGDNLISDIRGAQITRSNAVLFDSKNKHPDYQGRKIRDLREILNL